MKALSGRFLSEHNNRDPGPIKIAGLRPKEALVALDLKGIFSKDEDLKENKTLYS